MFQVREVEIFFESDVVDHLFPRKISWLKQMEYLLANGKDNQKWVQMLGVEKGARET